MNEAYEKNRKEAIDSFKAKMKQVQETWENKMRDECYDGPEQSNSSINDDVSTLDFKIKWFTERNEQLSAELKRNVDALNQLKKVRKLVTPEMEAAIKAMRSVGLV